MNIVKSKTLWLAGLTAAVGITQQVAPFIPAQYAGVALAVSGLLTAVLRTVTTQPLSEK